MAEKEQKDPKKQEKSGKQQAPAPEKKRPIVEENNEMLIRIYGYDIPGSKNMYSGLIRIKGISWAISNAVCLQLNIPHSKKISELSKDDIKKIEDFLDNLTIPDFLKNRRRDRETGETAHFYGTDLDMKRDFDIKRLKEIKSYKGIRHALKLPVRGQRTRSHFRTHKTVAVGRKAKVAVKK